MYVQESASEDELWLAEVLFHMLDQEVDAKIRTGIELILQSLLQFAIEHHLSSWFTLSREILTSTESGGTKTEPDQANKDGDEDHEDDAEEVRFPHAITSSRFRIRIKILSSFELVQLHKANRSGTRLAGRRLSIPSTVSGS